MYVLGAEKKLLSKPFYICSQNLVLKYSSLGSFALLLSCQPRVTVAYILFTIAKYNTIVYTSLELA